MNTPIAPWVHLTLDHAQRCHHLAWFLCGWLEREQVLNRDAFVAWWFRGAAPAPGRTLSCRRDGLDTVPAARATGATEWNVGEGGSAAELERFRD